jgi:hypothetical protein
MYLFTISTYVILEMKRFTGTFKSGQLLKLRKHVRGLFIITCKQVLQVLVFQNASRPLANL